MSRSEAMATSVQELIALFEPATTERETLHELSEMAGNPEKWSGAHALFQRIRTKGLAAHKSGDEARAHQYAFEEFCAKTFYNLTQPPAPFDAHSPFFVIPSALRLARDLGIPETEVVRVVARATNGAI